MATQTKKKKGKKKPKLTGDALKAHKLQSEHKTFARSLFANAGFARFPKLVDKQLNVSGQNGDIDDIFVFENVVVLMEYTTKASSGIGEHLKPKKIFFDKIQNDAAKFCSDICTADADLASALSAYQFEELVVRIVYASRNDIDSTYKANVPNVLYLDYPYLRYFHSLAQTIRKSSRYELLDFLQVPESDLGEAGQVGVGAKAEQYQGSVLPQTNSNFPKGFQVVSFYVDPLALIKRAYVLRRDGWRQTDSVYQRMLSKKKIDNIRRHLKKQKRVFVNNIIATLPEDTLIATSGGQAIDSKTITKTTAAKITIPDRINTIGLIDGQHRTYSYFEATPDDTEIATMRKKQNLLVTGVVYPHKFTEAERQKFEARLFLEINSNQTNAKSNLKQAIGLVLDPFSDESVATRVLSAMDRSGPLGGLIQRYWFDDHKLKTTSIVSFALKQLVRPADTGESLFSLWPKTAKTEMVATEDHDLLDEYIKYCVAQINQFLSAAKSNLGDRWTVDKSVAGRMLNTTNINGLLICLRFLVRDEKAKGEAFYKASLHNLSAFVFKTYKSSQYTKMATKLAETYF